MGTPLLLFRQQTHTSEPVNNKMDDIHEDLEKELLMFTRLEKVSGSFLHWLIFMFVSPPSGEP